MGPTLNSNQTISRHGISTRLASQWVSRADARAIRKPRRGSPSLQGWHLKRGYCGLRWCYRRTVRGSFDGYCYSVSGTTEAGVLYFCSWDPRENSSLMPFKTKQVCFLAVFLGVVFLGTQLHCCAALNSGNTQPHVCPICSTAATALATPVLITTMVPTIHRLEIFASIVFACADCSRVTSPRAPPIL